MGLFEDISQHLDAGGAVSGGLSGAATGAAIGSIVPGIGTAIGAGAGALLGGISGSGALSGGGTQANIQNPISPDQLAQGQSNVEGSYGAQSDLNNALMAQNALGNQSNVYNAYGQIANGQGPNPALNQLNQATGQNVANQAALAAGQRGAGANVGLMARQVGQQGAATQQNAVGQAATLQAQQQQAALAAQAGIAQNQVGNLANSTANLGSEALANQGQQYGAIANVNSSNVGSQGSVNQANTATQGLAASALGGVANGVGGAAGLLKTPVTNSGFATTPMAPSSAGAFGASAEKGGMVGKEKVTPPRGENPKLSQVPQSDRYGGAVMSPMPEHLTALHQMYHGGMLMKSGGSVPGKAAVKGNSPKNDTVPAMLSPGEVVIPKSVMESDDPAGGAAKFVAALAKKNKKAPDGEFREALKRAVEGRKSK